MAGQGGLLSTITTTNRFTVRGHTTMTRIAMTWNLLRQGAPAAGLALLLAVGPTEAQQQTQTGQPQTTQQTQTGTPTPSPAAPRTEPIRLETVVGEPPTPPAPPIADGAINLSLEEAIEIALRNNLDLVVERYNRQQANLAILQALGIYDTALEAEVSATDRTNPTDDPLRASAFSQRAATVNLAQGLPNGGLVQLGVESTQREQTASGRTAEFFESGVIFSLNQPLLRGFGRNNVENSILLARTRGQSSLQQFETQVTTTIDQIVDAYWNLVEAQEQLLVAQESLNLARELHDRNRIQVEVGTMAPLELVQSEAAIAEREEAIILSQTAIGDAEDVLRLLLNLPVDGQYWRLPIRPVTRPESERLAIDLDSAIRTALEERPELLFQDLAIEEARIQAAFYRNQTLPELNLNLNYNILGGGEDNFGQAFEQVAGIDFDGWSATLEFSYPLQNRAARAQSAIANLEVDQQTTTRELLEDQITTEVRQAVRGVESAAKQIEAASASRRFQERNLDAERKRYENGMSTTFEITQIQEDLTQARQREVSAIINYRRAVSDFYRVTGQLLEEEGIELVDPSVEYRRFEFSLFR